MAVRRGSRGQRFSAGRESRRGLAEQCEGQDLQQVREGCGSTASLAQSAHRFEPRRGVSTKCDVRGDAIQNK